MIKDKDVNEEVNVRQRRRVKAAAVVVFNRSKNYSK